MAKQKFTLEISANNEVQSKAIAGLAQWVFDNVAPNDIEKLLTKVMKKPSLVKTAILLA